MTKTLLTGWFSVREEEVTAGDVLALRRVQDALGRAGLAYDTVRSPGYAGEVLRLDDVRPESCSRCAPGPRCSPSIRAPAGPR
ncbi:hypothetical protein [Streptomyces sp. UG1]|uniref:hypothetical protein n=1 Tax=Streptomyces sp. UG1 TaxID=3417652 RepID=UPI003CE886D4